MIAKEVRLIHETPNIRVIPNNKNAVKIKVEPTRLKTPSRFGEMKVQDGMVLEFEEKPQMESGYINGGFFVFNKRVLLNLSEDENCDFEFGPIQEMAKNGQIKAFIHDGFWQCMDNVRERDYLNKLVHENDAPWVLWE